MSHAAMNAAMKSAPQENASDRLVLWALANEANSEGTACWPSIKRLADHCGMSRRNVHYALDRLAEAGLIASHQRAGTSSHYVLNLDGLAAPSRDAECKECYDIAVHFVQEREADPVVGGVQAPAHLKEHLSSAGACTPVRTDGVQPAAEGVCSPLHRGCAGPCTQPVTYPVETRSSLADGCADGEGEHDVDQAGTDPPERPGEEPHEHDAVADAVADACGLDRGALTRSEAGRLGRAAAELREVVDDLEEISRRAKAYRARWPDVALTPTALAANWGQLADPEGGAAERPPRDLAGEISRIVTNLAGLPWPEVRGGLVARGLLDDEPADGPAADLEAVAETAWRTAGRAT